MDKLSVDNLRKNPTVAFEALNIERNGKLSLAELCIVPEDLEKNMPLLALHGVSQRFSLSKHEFCVLAKDDRVISDEALKVMGELCGLRGGSIEDPEELRRRLDDASTSTTIALQRAWQLKWRNECVARRDRGVEDTDMVLRFELTAQQFQLVDSAFYDPVHLAPCSASVFAVVYGMTPLVKTKVKTGTVAVDYPPVHCTPDGDALHVALFARSHHVNIFLGKTADIQVTEEEPEDGAPSGPNVAIGPLDLLDAEGFFAGRIFGSMKWVRESCVQEDNKDDSICSNLNPCAW